MNSLTLLRFRPLKLSDRTMKILFFYMITCVIMATSTLISGLQWSGANGVKEFLLMIFRDKPSILFGTILIFILSGIHMHIGKAYFNVSYFENGIMWLSTSWVSFLVLWAVYDILPNRWELLGSVMGQCGLWIALYGRAT